MVGHVSVTTYQSPRISHVSRVTVTSQSVIYLLVGEGIPRNPFTDVRDVVQLGTITVKRAERPKSVQKSAPHTPTAATPAMAMQHNTLGHHTR